EGSSSADRFSVPGQNQHIGIGEQMHLRKSAFRNSSGLRGGSFQGSSASGFLAGRIDQIAETEPDRGVFVPGIEFHLEKIPVLGAGPGLEVRGSVGLVVEGHHRKIAAVIVFHDWPPILFRSASAMTAYRTEGAFNQPVLGVLEDAAVVDIATDRDYPRPSPQE